MQTYIVTLKFQHPAWDEKEGIPYEVTAKTKADAIKRARRMAENDGHAGPWVTASKGRQTFTATAAA